ncbi:MAG: phosphoribosylanthranilate isomerase [Gemmatimonadaceae bacterium]
MSPPPIPLVKICCIASVEEMSLALDAGADALGFVSKMPSGPGPIDEELITSIIARVPEGTATFLLTSETSAEAIVAQQRRTGANTLQLVDEVEPGSHAALRDSLPGIRIVQVIHVADARSVHEAVGVAADVDALLLDSGNPRLAVKELGGTGRIHDWSVSREIRERSGIPVYLAGGLNAGNVATAIAAVRPAGVDVCSGVRTEGRLDPGKLRAFVSAVRAG